MRITGEHSLLALDRPPQQIAALLHPEFLSTVRFEPVFRERLGCATLDMLFEQEEQSLVVTGVVVDMLALSVLDGPAFVWPQRVSVPPESARAMENHIFAWLRTLVRGRGASDEQIRSYRPSALFHAARERGFLGAAPSARSLVQISPFVFARRFAAGADVLIHSARGYEAAALIGDVARSIRQELPAGCPAEELEIARRWYGDTHVGEAAGPATVAIVDDVDDPHARGIPYVVATAAASGVPAVIVPEPAANDHLFTFDPADAPEALRFSVRAHDPVSRPIRASVNAAVSGGSGGRICFVLRDDAGYAPDADVDYADELERRLTAEGLEVTRSATAADPAIKNCDLAHVFGAVGDAHVIAAIKSATAAGTPFVLSLAPLAAPYTAYAEDGLLRAMRFGFDQSERSMFLRAYFNGKLVIDEIPSALDPAEINRRDREFAKMCENAVAILLSPHDDITDFLRRFPEIPAERVSLCGVLIGVEPAEESIAFQTPAQPFIFIHAPFVLRSNVQFVLGALAGASCPIVVAGQMADVDLGITLRRIGPRDAIILPDPTPGQVASLYRRAALFVDSSHRPTGVGRIVRAAQAGAIPLVPHWSPFAKIVGSDNVFDGQTFESAARDLHAAMARTDLQARAQRLAALYSPMVDPYSAFTDVVQAYAAGAT